jgi:hypothetical protein
MIVLGTVCAGACAVSSEEQVLTRFFEASRALDSTQLYGLATIAFDPRSDGSIQTFAIAQRGAEERSPLSESHREGAVRSLSATTGASADPSALSVEIVTRQVTVDATVRRPDGALVPAKLSVTLERAIATGKGAVVEGRWIVTRLQPAPAARTSHAASSVPQS